MALAAGDRLGAYEIRRLLGAGGMGEVYEAHDTRLGRPVAIKVLPEDLAADPGRLARLHREARTVAGLNHPNIVTLHAIEEASGTPFLVMERIEGRSLAESIPKGGLPLRRILDIAIPIADALAAAHESGVVHRDLKPANVMLARDGRVKVLDFGLARAPATSEAAALAAGPTATVAPALTADHQVLGTLPYMAPEQVRGEPVDARADIFALGTMLYEMATGASPFAGTSSADVLSAILREDPPPLLQVRSELPPMFARLVARCMEKDRRARLQSAVDLSHELQDIAQEITNRHTATEHASSARRGVALAAAAIVITLAGAGILIAPQLRETPSHPPSAATIRSVAVLPFDNLMRDPAQDYFVDGMHDALITELAKLGTLRVTSRTTVMTYRNSPAAVKAIARELGVDAVIEGSVLRSGNTIRITAQLVLGGTDEHVWADKYDGDLANVLALLDNVSRQVAAAVQRATGAPGTLQAPVVQVQQPAVRPEAYDEYLKARQRWFESSITTVAPTLRRDYQRVVELDPGFAKGWSGLASSNFLMAFFGLEDPAQVLPAARAAAQKAMALDALDGEAYAVLGSIALYYDWSFEQARSLLERAVALGPHLYIVRHAYADYLMVVGRSEESLEQVRQARLNAPTSPLSHVVLVAHLVFAGKYEEAVAEGERLVEAVPAQTTVHAAIADALWRQGRYDDAIAVYRRVYPAGARVPALLADTLRVSGPRAALKVIADASKAGDGPPGTTLVSTAGFYAQAGERDTAVQLLQQAYDRRLPQLLHAFADPAFDGIRDHPAYVAMARRVGLPRSH